MPKKQSVALFWSGGKDSALALRELKQSPRYEVALLLTTVAEPYGRVSHHGVRSDLLERQAEALALPLRKVYFPGVSSEEDCAHSRYEATVEEALQALKEEGLGLVAYGDIFLKEVRSYREEKLERLGLEGLFPLWGRDTKALVETFIEEGFRAWISCVDGEKLGEAFAGRALDARFLRDLPEGTDPCGERGEYHSFVWDGPVFGHAVATERAQTVFRGGRYFTELLPKETEPLPKEEASLEEAKKEALKAQ